MAKVNLKLHPVGGVLQLSVVKDGKAAPIADESEPTAELIGKSDCEIVADYCLSVAKVRGQSLEQLFSQKPELYSWYRQLVNGPGYY